MNSTFLRLCRIVPLAAVSLTAFAAAPDTLQSVEKSASEWVKTRVETVRLETEWASDQVLLKSTIHALQERAKLIEERRDEIKAQTAEERAELDALTAKQQAAAAETDLLEQRLKALSVQLLALRPVLPPRLSDALEMSFRSLAGTELSVGERMQLAMTVLNRCAQFNRSINYGGEVLTLDGESAAKSLDVIYWGLSHGYALDPATGKAWFGSPGPEKWQWDARPELAPRVAELIAIHTDKADPGFVTVPAHVKKTFTASAQ
jgi:hypothetical protein